ncbi:MAG: aminopeptidase P N-terminal domain-containing protein [Candidatus Sericytochromatia bacterium]|nr:aminopeptidase P N-terminal domain-containing protein [Candidatus Sericytochromatia bacterium]
MSMFAARRKRFLEQMGHGIAILPTRPHAVRSNDVEFPYRFDSDFWYLTGFGEPDAVAVFVPGREAGEFILFVPPRDPEREVWTGRRAGVEGALARFGAHEAHALDDLDKVIPELLKGQERVWFPWGRDPHWDERVRGWIEGLRGKTRMGLTPPAELVDPLPRLHEMRLFKQEDEIILMRRAAEIAAEAHKAAMRAARPGGHEYELQATLEYVFRMRGSQGPSYHPICGSGANACILHYNQNDGPLNEGDLVLIDAGCEVEGYASDITRTFPVSGTFSPEQRAVYDVVLAAQQAAIARCVPGTAFDDVHAAALEVLVAGLADLGILQGTRDELIASGAYRPYYMHRTSHWLGLDVHDVGTYRQQGKSRTLQPGMVLTVEPGLYLAAGTPGLDARWHDIGIRIEDDVLVTADAPVVLTAGVPTDPDAIMAWMAGGPAPVLALPGR